jgi:hypothetical protein
LYELRAPRFLSGSFGTGVNAYDHQETLRQLQALDFSGRGEAHVEQKFITPLLACLGYESHRDYEVFRHGDEGASFTLNYPPVERGAARVKHYNPDYRPTIRKKAFWIIEAKSPKDVSYPFEPQYIVQGLQYCIHPEIQAKYLLLTNGADSAVYDAQASAFLGGEMYEPILTFKSRELIERWEEIYTLLSVERLRGRIEVELKAMYDKLCLSSLDERYPQHLLRQIGASQGEHTKAIRHHVNKLAVEKMTQSRTARDEYINGLSAAEIFKLMDFPCSPGESEGGFFVRKSLSEGLSHETILNQAVNDFEKQTIFRKEQSFNVACIVYQTTQDTALKNSCRAFFDRYKDGFLPLINQVECAGLRVFRKLAVLSLYPHLRQQISHALETAPELVRFVQPPTAFEQVFPFELETHDRLFRKLQGFPESQLTQWLKELLALEKTIESSFQEARSKLSDAERQIAGFETYGVGGSHYSFKNMLHNRGIELRPELTPMASPKAAPSGDS